MLVGCGEGSTSIGDARATASAVTIVGRAVVGQELKGSYTYEDMDGGPPGIATFRWLRDGSPISGATGQSYTLVGADDGALIVFEVTSGASGDASRGAAAQSAAIGPVTTPATVLADPGDPVMLEVRVAAGTDDAEEDPSGSMDLGSSDLELVYDGGGDQTVGMRFTAVTIPHGATIEDATIQFQVDETNSGTTPLTIRGQASDDAPTFSTARGNISSRSTTTSMVPWSPVAWTAVGQAGAGQETPDVRSIIQEIVNRPGWLSGNSLVIIITGTGERTAESYNGVPNAAPLLRVNYSGGGSPGNSAPTANFAWLASGLNAGFTDGSTDRDGTVTGWSWDFGDGGTSTAENPTHTYASGGDYPVTLIAADNFGATSGAVTKTVTVFANPGGPGVVFVGAGDIARCGSGITGAEQTARLLDAIPGTVFTTGDNAYSDGTALNFAECYDPTWGRHRSRTRPSPGNHDYHTIDAQGYFDYFGDAAGSGATGYYSYDLGEWHVISLNSEIDMSAGSPQEQWLRADLAASPRACTVAYWHAPRFSSGENHGSSTSSQPLWEALYESGAELVLNGHDHVYERFAPQTPGGTLDSERGVRQFTVGTGGAGLYAFSLPLPNSEARNNGGWGVLKLSLYPGGYLWEFVPVAGSTYTDVGGASCH